MANTSNDHPTKPDPKTTAILQRMLVNMGEDLGSAGKHANGVDGDFGPKTKAAMEKVCHEIGMDPKAINLSKPPAEHMAKLMAHAKVRIAENVKQITSRKHDAHIPANGPEPEIYQAGSELKPSNVPKLKASGPRTDKSV